MQSLFIATRNLHKLREIQQIIEGLPLVLRSLGDVGEIPEIIEDGETFEANACKKAIVTAKHTGMITLADDSGLVVDALGGQPGIYSARFAGPEADDDKNNEKLLSLMKNISEPRRTARFVCVIAVAAPDGSVQTVRGSCEGHISFKRTGKEGFGYDPLFVPAGFDLSFAELDPTVKNKISHRAKALQNVRPVLENFL
jgi:XTP/dITP diphosphohydrolase